MAQSKTTGMTLRVPDQGSRDLGLAFANRGIDGRAHGSTTRSGSYSKSAFRAIYFLVLLVIAICLPIVGRSVHVPEGARYASNSSGGLGARVPSISDSRMLRSGIVASSRLRSLLANPSVSADLVPALREALVSDPGPVDSLRVRARSPLGPVVAQRMQETDSDFPSWFIGSPTRPKEAVASESRLARLTTYWPEEGDSYTKRGLSSTGVRLRDGHCAVDPKVIPYGSVVAIPGVGEFVAVDTGPAVVSRRAARQFGRNPDERGALVVDVYCSSRLKANAFEASAPEFAVITWSR